jgi:hypothetical protein
MIRLAHFTVSFRNVMSMSEELKVRWGTIFDWQGHPRQCWFPVKKSKVASAMRQYRGLFDPRAAMNGRSIDQPVLSMARGAMASEDHPSAAQTADMGRISVS